MLTFPVPPSYEVPKILCLMPYVAHVLADPEVAVTYTYGTHEEVLVIEVTDWRDETEAVLAF